MHSSLQRKSVRQPAITTNQTKLQPTNAMIMHDLELLFTSNFFVNHHHRHRTSKKERRKTTSLRHTNPHNPILTHEMKDDYMKTKER
jgi:hypothetical protein